MIPGEMKVAAGDLELNKGRETVTLQVTNGGDRPVQVGSHYHFFETNDALKFERKAAYGPKLRKHPFRSSSQPSVLHVPELLSTLAIDTSVREVDRPRPGEKKAIKALPRFLKDNLSGYAHARNDPNRSGQSGLPPYLHFGQISTQRIALEVMAAKAPKHAKDAFLEELIVRRELSDNYCLYHSAYDAFSGFPVWAKKTLNDHRRDKRDRVDTLKEFEHAETHDELWNAAQREMAATGKMHGYLRMYWQKRSSNGQNRPNRP